MGEDCELSSRKDKEGLEWRFLKTAEKSVMNNTETGEGFSFFSG